MNLSCFSKLEVKAISKLSFFLEAADISVCNTKLTFLIPLLSTNVAPNFVLSLNFNGTPTHTAK